MSESGKPANEPSSAPRRSARKVRIRVWLGLALVLLGVVGLTAGGTVPVLLAVGGVAGAAGLIMLLWSVGRSPARARDADDPRQTWDALSKGEDPTDTAD